MRGTTAGTEDVQQGCNRGTTDASHRTENTQYQMYISVLVIDVGDSLNRI